ncbi:MAG: hypothetical protein SOY42_11055 [Clostridium sp.]|nr:hypothetical protein [Clostridium sp.]
MKNKVLFIFILIFYFISALSIFIVPLPSIINISQYEAGIIVAIIFWGGFVIGSILSVAFLMSNKDKVIVYKKNALFRYFTNLPSKINDSILIVSLLIIIFSTYLNINYWILVVIGFLFILTMEFHFIFNGKIYIYLKSEK